MERISLTGTKPTLAQAHEEHGGVIARMRGHVMAMAGGALVDTDDRRVCNWCKEHDRRTTAEGCWAAADRDVVALPRKALGLWRLTLASACADRTSTRRPPAPSRRG